MRENDGAFVLLPGLDRSKIEKDDWGAYVRFFADPESGMLKSAPEIPDSALLEAAMEAVAEALARGEAGIEGTRWSASVKAVRFEHDLSKEQIG
jgi:hypothetical protein